MQLTTDIVDTSKRYMSMCAAATDLQELYNPDTFAFLFGVVMHPDYDRDEYDYIRYEPSLQTHIFMSMTSHDTDVYWTSIWVPTFEELFSLTEQHLHSTTKRPTHDCCMSILDSLKRSQRDTYDANRTVSQHMLCVAMRLMFDKRYVMGRFE